MTIRIQPLYRPIPPAARKEVPLATFLKNLDLLVGGKIQALPQMTYLHWRSQAHIFTIGGRAACLFSPFRWGRASNYADAVVTAELKSGKAVVHLTRAANPSHLLDLTYDREEGSFYYEKNLNGEPCRHYFFSVPHRRNLRVKGLLFHLNETFQALCPIILAFNGKGEFVKGLHDEYQPLIGEKRPILEEGRISGWLLASRLGQTGMEEVQGVVEGWAVYTTCSYLKLHFGGRNYVISRKRFEQLGLPANTAKVDLRIEQGFISDILGKEPIRAILVRDAEGRIRHASFRTVPKESFPGLPAIIEGANSYSLYGKEQVKLFERAYPLPGGDPDLTFRQISVLLGPGPAILHWEPAPRFADRSFGFVNRYEMNEQLDKAARKFIEDPSSRILARHFLRIYNRALKVLTLDQVLPFRIAAARAFSMLK